MIKFQKVCNDLEGFNIKTFSILPGNNSPIYFIKLFKDMEPPLLPLRAITLMTKYNIPEGKELGSKLKKIEEKWVDNNFKISEKEVQQIVNN